MDDHQYRTVVQGEASESEEEEEVSLPNKPEPKPHGVVVEGEASESEEEELDSNGNALPSTQQKSNENSSSYESIDDIADMPSLAPKQMWKPKYDSVLNRKLWESNMSFCNNINAMASHTYMTAAKDIVNCAQQLSRSHAAIQDVSHNMRLLTNDLFNLDDRVDIIVSCKLLPEVNISAVKKETSGNTTEVVETAQAAEEA